MSATIEPVDIDADEWLQIGRRRRVAAVDASRASPHLQAAYLWPGLTNGRQAQRAVGHWPTWLLVVVLVVLATAVRRRRLPRRLATGRGRAAVFNRAPSPSWPGSPDSKR